MKPLAYSLINSFFFQKDVAFSQKFYFVQDGFSQTRTRGRGNENIPFFFAVWDCTLAYLKHLINKPLWTDFRNHVLLNAARVFGAQALINHVRFGNSGTPFFVFVLFCFAHNMGWMRLFKSISSFWDWGFSLVGSHLCGDRTPRVILQRHLVPNRFQSRGRNVNFK